MCGCWFFSYVLPPLFLLEWVALIFKWWGKSCILTIQPFKNDFNHWQQANNLILPKSGYPRLIDSVFLDRHCSSYRDDHSARTMMGHSMMSMLLGECFLSYLRHERALNGSTKGDLSQLPHRRKEKGNEQWCQNDAISLFSSLFTNWSSIFQILFNPANLSWYLEISFN